MVAAHLFQNSGLAIQTGVSKREKKRLREGKKKTSHCIFDIHSTLFVFAHIFPACNFIYTMLLTKTGAWVAG